MTSTLPDERRHGAPRVIVQGIRDGDAVVYELFPMQTVLFDGRASTFQSVPLPIFDSSEYATGVLSVMIRSVASFTSGSRARLWIQNAVQSADDPAQILASNATALTVESTPVPPVLKSAVWLPAGPSGRLLIEWQQGAAGFLPARATFAVWLTLRRA